MRQEHIEYLALEPSGGISADGRTKDWRRRSVWSLRLATQRRHTDATDLSYFPVAQKMNPPKGIHPPQHRPSRNAFHPLEVLVVTMAEDDWTPNCAQLGRVSQKGPLQLFVSFGRLRKPEETGEPDFFRVTLGMR